MKKLSLVLGIALLLFVSCAKKDGSTYSYNNTWIAHLLEITADSVLKVNQSPGVAIMIWAPDRNLLWSRCKGKSDLQTGAELNLNHQFCIASITKSFVGTIIMQLMEERKLDLDDNLDKWFSSSFIDSLNFKNDTIYGHLITIRMLLNHTSGMPDFEDSDFLMGVMNNPHRQWTPMEVLRSGIMKYPPSGKPGEVVSYSNLEFFVLGMLIEKIENEPLHLVIRKHILEPLGMKDTYMANYEFPTSNLCHGYFIDSTDVTDYNISWEWACGGLISTINDLHRFHSGLRSGRLFIKSTTTDIMLKDPVWLSNESGFGLALQEWNLGGRRMWGHTGGGLGYSSEMVYYPDKNVYIIGFDNQFMNPTILNLYTALIKKF